MAFFGKILEKLGFGSSAAAAPQQTTAAPGSPGAAPTEAAPKAVAVVDVVGAVAADRLVVDECRARIHEAFGLREDRGCRRAFRRHPDNRH